MGDGHELLNLRAITVTTRAAEMSAPQHAEAHRLRASQLLDDALERTSSLRVREAIHELRRELDGHAAEPAES